MFSRALPLPGRADLLTFSAEFHHQLAMSQKRRESLLWRQALCAGQQSQPGCIGDFRLHGPSVTRPHCPRLALYNYLISKGTLKRRKIRGNAAILNIRSVAPAARSRYASQL